MVSFLSENNNYDVFDCSRKNSFAKKLLSTLPQVLKLFQVADGKVARRPCPPLTN
jgi:hypothetical protein